MNRPPATDWRTYLHALPEADPDPALWQRLREAKAGRRADSRRRWLPAAGLAAAVALAAVMAWPARSPSPGVPVPAVAMATAEAADPGAVRALDDAIALAYANNASQDELDALWQTRDRLMQGGGGDAPLLARL